MALTFDGSTEYLSASAALVSARPITMCGWIRPDDNQSHAIISLIDSGDAGGMTNYSGYMSVGPGKYGRWDMYWAKQRTATGTSQYAGGSTWYHMVAQVLGDNSRALFVDGSSVATAATGGYVSDIASADTLYLGHVGVTGTGGTNGISGLTGGATTDGGMAEIAIWNIQLTTNQISALAAGFSPLLVRPDALIGYWPLGGPYAHATAYIDVVGSNNLSQTGGMDAANLEQHPPMIYPTSPTVITGGVIAAPIPILASGMCT